MLRAVVVGTVAELVAVSIRNARRRKTIISRLICTFDENRIVCVAPKGVVVALSNVADVIAARSPRASGQHIVFAWPLSLR